MTGPMPAPATRKTRGVLIGVLLMIAAPIVGIGMVAFGFIQLSWKLDSRPRMAVPGTQSFTLEAGEYVLYGSSSGTTASEVTITGPGGAPVAIGPSSGLVTANVGSKSFVAFGTFKAPTTGSYRFEVTDSSRPSSTSAELMIGPDSSGDLGITLGLVFGGMALGAILFIAGLVVMIVALVRRSRARRPPPFGAPPPGYRTR